MKKYTIIGLLISLVLVSGCAPGETVEYEKIVFFERDDMRGCGRNLDSAIDSYDSFVIDSQEEYQEMLDLYSDTYSCEWGKAPPKIDFSQRTLLGKFTKGGGCGVEFIPAVYMNAQENKIIYRISVEQEGYCDMIGFSMNWIIIPKIPAGYNVVFEVKE